MDTKEVVIDDNKDRFNVYIKMIETRIDDLIQIYINERNNFTWEWKNLLPFNLLGRMYGS